MVSPEPPTGQGWTFRGNAWGPSATPVLAGLPRDEPAVGEAGPLTPLEPLTFLPTGQHFSKLVCVQLQAHGRCGRRTRLLGVWEVPGG